MTRTSGQERRVFVGDLLCACGWFGRVDWEFDPEVDPSATYADCPDCGSEVMRPTSEGIF